MSARFFFPLFLVCIQAISFAQNDLCTKEELIEAFSEKSSKFRKAHQLVSTNNLEDAYVLIDELLSDAESTKDNQLKIHSLFLKADLLYQNKSYQKSLETYNTLIENKNLNEDIKFFSLLNIGNVYATGLDKFEEGVKYYKKTQELFGENSCLDKQILLYSTLAYNNLIKKEYDEAEAYYEKVLEIYLTNNKFNDAAIVYNNLGNLNFEQYKDDKAKDYFIKASNIINKKDSTNIVIRQTVNENLSAVYEADGDFKKSFSYLTQSNILRDSIWNRDKVWEIAEYDKKLAISEKQKELTVLEAENKAKIAQRNGVILSALVLLLLLVISIYYYVQKVKTNKIISSQNKTLDHLNATKDKLFSIVSHDLRSSVNALKTNNKTLVNSLKSDNIEKLDGLITSNSNIVNGAYNLLDNLLNWAMLQTKQTYFLIEPHRLHHLVAQVAYNYEALFAEKDITFKNEVSKKAKVKIDKESFKIIIRNILDNSIKFSQQDGEISVYTEEETAVFNVIIEDNGLGMTADKKAELLSDNQLLSKKENEDIIGTGLGMQLCKSLIKKNNGKLDIETQFGIGTKIIVSLPKADVNG